MDCGWMSTSIFSAGTPKSQRASMTSKPLFISDAESMVIFAPMSHVGWRSASAAVTWRSCSWVNLRKGPPEQVSSSLLISLSPSPTKLWKMAECSESTGRMGTRYASASWQINSPATTKVSLLARQIVFRARMARIVGVRPLNPTIAVSTIVIGPASTIWHTASRPA